jgi:hypothetical protein
MLDSTVTESGACWIIPSDSMKGQWRAPAARRTLHA